jgi:1-acyl-sn-glycerol-3-phosphate acyltransferase
MAVLLSLLFWGFMLVSSALLFPLAVLVKILTFLFDPRLVVLHRFTCWWASLYTWCNPFWTVSITGREKIDRRAALVYVSNHQSLADILVLFRLFTHFRWVSKAENFRIPLIGWNMSLNRYIRIERGSIRGSMHMMRDAEATLRAGNSVMVFPEGTRSSDGHLRPFKEGAFDLAFRTGSPVMPIAIDGTASALPKGGFILSGATDIRVHVLDAIPPTEFGDAGPAGLATLVAGRIAGELARMRRPSVHEPAFRPLNGSPSP